MLTNAQAVAEVTAAVRSAETHAAHGDQPPDPEGLVRDQIRYLARYAPGAGCAAGVISTCGTPIVPLELPGLTPAGDPLASLEQVLDHWHRRPQDGVGIPAGRQADGSAIFAIQFDNDATWRVWLTENALTTSRFRDHDTGNEVVRSPGGVQA